ncbi:uncharacterized protein L3040_003401 [Drepanopeziza brunnea f. sp. 'multigermtubi']|uniref:uncharacterized protein n=1 Tax=Drepanopeziza brunnea f. sp. 'multigermtubi' TaxID=698441 RepID=UPI00238B7831|nr:hypothetical protein L3040_003401 [Drepanopeziza brunnea f. sp. 'multigermtubi']
MESRTLMPALAIPTTNAEDPAPTPPLKIRRAKYRLAATGRLRLGLFISPAVTTSSSGANRKGKAEEIRTLKKQIASPALPVRSCLQLDENVVELTSTAPKQDEGQDEQRNHHENFERRKPEFSFPIVLYR